ncbi:MAG: phosphoribosylanthranilate isomerase, partial [Bdellovibrionales bacterium]
AVNSGASFIGFVFFKESPRHIEPTQASILARGIPDVVEIVGLFVDPSDAEIHSVLSQVPITMIQLHGLESPERVAEVKEKFHIPVMKAIPIADESDLEYVRSYSQVADWLLFDTKMVDGTSGGSGVSFDWSVLSKVRTTTPWFLAGGLTPENVGGAIEMVSPPAVDVSSGVESSRGVKDPAKIKLFLKNAME